MATDIAHCRKCGSRYVMFVGASEDGILAYHWYGYDCDADTPDRPTLRATDADVDWRPAPRVPAGK